MGNSTLVNYTRKFTNKLGDGSFESVELGGSVELELSPIADIDEATSGWDQLADKFIETVEAKVLASAEALMGRPRDETSQVEQTPQTKDAALTKWVKKQVDTNTATIQKGITQRASQLPGERFQKPPQRQRPEVTTADITEGEAVAFDDVKVFHDNSQTKIGRTKAGKKFGMLRLGKRDEIPGDYVTGKSFDPEVVPQIEAIIGDEENGPVQNVDVYGYFEARNNDPDVFDLVIQGVQPS